MEKVKKKRARRHRIRNLHLVWSFMLYVILCIVVAATVSFLLSSWFMSEQSDIYYRYQDEYLLSLGVGREEVSEAMQMRAYSIYYDFTQEDEGLYNLYGMLAALSIPIACLICILLTGVLFYWRKLRTPLVMLDKASSRIAQGDLDFSLAYENRNEMGRLVKSFETMRSALQENSREMWRRMEERKRLNSAFAHDLRTPLTVLKGYTEYLSTYMPRKQVSEEKMISTIDLMHSYVTRLEGYTNSMSTVQGLEERRPNPQTISFDALCARLKSAADILRGSFLLKFVDSGSGDVNVDPDLIVQVMENLVSNASRFARHEINLNILLNPEERELEITICDDGPGFAEAVLLRGTVPYNRDKHQDEKSRHYGLGLYICSILCQRHGGQLILPKQAGESKISATFRLLAGA